MRLNTGTFFKDKQGMDSTSALLLFMTWFPATYVLIVNQNENLYYAYLAAFTGLAANKQWASRGNTLDSTQSTQISLDADSGAVDVVSSKKNLGSVKPVRKR